MSDAPITELPLFPLQSVLFPDGLLPLRIFEVRYLDMIGRAHEAGTPFGVVTLRSGSEVRGAASEAETFHDVGTLARIDQLARPQPGLMLIRCTGLQRFRLARREQLKHGLWVGGAEPVPADATVAVPEDLQVAKRTLRRLLRGIEKKSGEAALPVAQPYRWEDCGWLANRWCELLPLPTEQRQRLMELDSPLLRLELVVDELKRFDIERKMPKD